MDGSLVHRSLPPNPDLLIMGELYRSSTFPTETNHSSPEKLKTFDENDETPLGELLRNCAEKGVSSPEGDFWSLEHLRRILSRDRILAELESYTDLESPATYLDQIHPEENRLPDSNTQTYLKIFALLALFERGEDIIDFIEEEVSDQNLPVRRHQTTSKGKVSLCRKDRPDQPLKCFEKWKTHEREGFESKQWRLLVPYFDLDSGSKAKHYNLDDETVLPWCERTDRSHGSPQPSGWAGGYAFVSRVKIDPCSHGFHELLKTVSQLHLSRARSLTYVWQIGLENELFAVKELQKLDKEDNKLEVQFRNELDQLRRFNGLVHDHLVTLLATYILKQNYYFLFPCAHGTLEDYWEDIERKPRMDITTARWVSKQCSGIMAAMDNIHEPKHQQSLEVKRYGRHGDIKPDNILWFHSSKDPKGILVVSDMGLTSFNRDTSRSNIPNSKLPGAPGYRPPECEIKGGTISRAFDIWTLGCLFLELLTYLLGGYNLIEEFGKQRNSVFLLTGSQNKIFFALKEIEGRDGYVAQVKPEVTKVSPHSRSVS
jgi:hypothetical protein